MRSIPNVFLVVSLGFAGLMGGGCGTGKTTDNNVSGIFGNSKKRDIAIDVLTLNGIMSEFFRITDSGCDGIQKATSNKEAYEYRAQCSKVAKSLIPSRYSSLGDSFLSIVYLVTVQIKDPNMYWWAPVLLPGIATSTAGVRTPDDEAYRAFRKLRENLDSATGKVAAEAYNTHETSEVAGLKVAKETARLLLSEAEKLRKRVDGAVADKFIAEKPSYTSLMKTLKEPMASPEFANLLPEVKEFYKSQVAGIEKQVADIEKSKQ